jgi:hypothetical protein
MILVKKAKAQYLNKYIKPNFKLTIVLIKELF